MSAVDPEEIPVVVIVNGSQTIKAGLAGDSGPSCVMPTLTGYPTDAGQKGETVIGDEAYSSRAALSLIHPIEKGIITDWGEMTKIWSHLFHNVLKISTETTPVLLTEPALNAKENREKMLQIMFDEFDVPACSIRCEPVLTLLGCGKITGVIVHSGHTVTQIVPIREGKVVTEDVKTVELAGKDVDQYLAKLLAEKGHSFTLPADEALIKDIKEKVCYTSLRYESELETSQNSNKIDQSYELPDGSQVTLKQDRIRAPEVLFQPSLNGQSGPGLGELVFNCISSSKSTPRTHFYKNIILSGGTTKLPGFQARLEKELRERVPKGQDVSVRFPGDANSPAWMGGSLLTCSPGFLEKMCVSKAEYKKRGAKIVHEK